MAIAPSVPTTALIASAMTTRTSDIQRGERA
jgi:hypothetical protein